jgi:hypothetical protein
MKGLVVVDIRADLPRLLDFGLKSEVGFEGEIFIYLSGSCHRPFSL